jgi:hypothetical protein
MPKRLLSSLTWKAGVAAAAFALAAGTGATTIHLINDSSTGDTPTVTSTSTHASDDAGDKADEDTAGQDKADDTKAEDDTADDAAKTANAGTAPADHPDNFGAVVSADAKDGVDGQQISDMAHAKNAARTNTHAQNDTTDGHDKADDANDKADDANDDHEVDGQDKADDANDDHGKPETSSGTADD